MPRRTAVRLATATTADLVCADPANGHTSAGSLATTAKSAITPAATTAALARSRRTQDAALQLAEGGAGQRRKCVDPFGALVARQSRVGVCDQGGFVECVSRAKGDPRGDLLAPVRVSHPGDGRLRDRWVILQHRFHLAGI